MGLTATARRAGVHSRLTAHGWEQTCLVNLAGSVDTLRARGRVRSHAQLGDHLVALAGLFCVSESLMVLRVAECLGLATALITRRVIRTRGEPRNWPSTREGWTELVQQARANPKGVTVSQLSDSRGRVVLRAGSAGSAIQNVDPD
jgi:hypothetical protein